ncbi:Metallo-dependent phosphatase-like [Phytophthora cactorum]|nr:Metallo-dependent phosphatase-like [Phytophthora cactorum]
MAISPKDATDKPSIDEFAQGKPLGEGNFSRILEATHKATGEKFALKVIEKQRIKRLRLRHQNIFNEINMEKDVLNRLRHQHHPPLLSHLLYEGRQLGLEENLARFYLADVVNAVEYMHSNQVLHRDLKPENMVVCKDTGGHLKLIDFGTAKNLADVKLNGPNFVGTPEYMPPETIDNKEATYSSDMWAFGCIAYQLLTGETPFSGGSAYLTFLRVQDGSYYLPDYLSGDAKEMISKLLQKDPSDRLGGTEANAMSAVKAHPFFKGIDFDNHMQAQQPTSQFCGSELFPLVKSLAAMEKARLYPRFFSSLSGPKLGHAAALAEADNRGGSTWKTESAAFLEAVTVLNSQQPAFVVIYGDFVNAKPSQEFYDAQVVAFQELLNQINPQVRLVFAAGSDEFGNNDELTKYQERFGDARFSFWCGGIKIIVVDTAMLCHGKDFEEEVAAQTEWMKKELENGKLCARGTVVISGHSLYPTVIDANTADTAESNNDRAALHDDIPEQLRAKYWDMIKNGQACLVVSGNSTINNVTSVVTKASEEGADEYKCEIVSCKAPWGGISSVIHHTEVSQAGVVTKAVSVGHSSASVRPGTTEATKHSSITPEEEGQETVLAAEMVTVSVNSARNDE